MGSKLRVLNLPFACCVVIFCLAAGSNAATPPNEPEVTAPPVIVIGFVGGFENPHDRTDGVVHFAAHLRSAYGSAVHVEVFQNHRRKKALKRVLELLDTNRDGRLAPEEKQNAAIILYGESWGGSETIALARALEKRSIPVLLTAQIDSVGKFGRHHRVIPANVAEAVSFYQPHGLVHGPREIHPADPAHTRIVGNFRFDYREHPVQCERYSWYERIFGTDHMQMECDSKVWDKVDLLIRSQVLREQEAAAGSAVDFLNPLMRTEVSFRQSFLSGPSSALHEFAPAPIALPHP